MPLKNGAINEILQFCHEGVESSSVHGDLLSLTQYKSSLERRRGHQPGIAKRGTANREARQATHVAAGVAQFIANRYAPGVRDDADLDKIEEGLLQAIAGIVQIAIEENNENNSGGDEDSGNEANCLARQLVYPGAFQSFMRKAPPPGWMVRNGGLVASADTVIPELWEELRKPESTDMLITEAQWQAMSDADPWNGIGGVPLFVLNASAKTIRLPDTRGMYAEDAGFDGLGVGGVHGDAIRNIYGALDGWIENWAPNPAGSLFSIQNIGTNCGHPPPNIWSSNGVDKDSLVFNAQNIVPTANKNQPRAFGVLGCVYVGTVE